MSRPSREAERQRIGGWVREQRIKGSWRQLDVAKAIGMTQTNYSKLERGLVSMSLEQFIDLAATFEIAPHLALRRALSDEDA
jgi:transcriptional regulator with XRE-family HTH domain